MSAAIVAGAVIAGGLGVAGSMMASDAQGDAAESAANSQRESNDANYRMFLESRGQGGSAVMPLYMRNADGSLFEKSLSDDMISAYNRSAIPLSRFQQAGARFRGAQTKAGNFANDIFDGGITNRLLTNAQPVQKAKVTFRKQSALDALHKTLNGIDAVQAGKGYAGDSYASNKMRFDANKGMSDELAGVNLENLQESRQIHDYGDVQLPMQNLSLPLAMMKQESDFEFLPQRQYIDALQQRMSPLSFLKIGGSQPFQYQPIPTAPPIASDGQLLAQGLGGVGNMVSNYAQQRQQEQMWQRLLGGGGGYTPTYTPPAALPSWSASALPSASMSMTPTVSAPASSSFYTPLSL